jgi:K+-sensing histidine kinase KdpD
MRIGMEKGADDFLIKPYTRDELIAAIDAQWNKHHLFEKQIRDKVEEVGRNVTYALPHEFRTVLNQVVGSARYLKSNASKIAEKEIQEMSDDILISAERLLKITENFLIYVRIESFLANEDRRRMLRHFRTDEPGAVIADIADLIASNYQRKKDLIIYESVEGVSIEISTESFHKIITELIDNAFRFSESGTPVKLRMWTANNQFFVSLADYGRGMTKEQINNVGAYIQFERSIYEQQGVGLGLVIAKRLVEIHDGSFGILSDEGYGTSVTFSLPCKTVPE